MDFEVVMSMGNFDFELADLRAEQEREAGIRRAQEALEGAGTSLCIDCEWPIDQARKAAMPSADRCLGCAQRRERFRGRRG